MNGCPEASVRRWLPSAILLLDEPTANLDLGHQAAIPLVRQRVRGACARVTHDLNLAARFDGCCYQRRSDSSLWSSRCA